MDKQHQDITIMKNGLYSTSIPLIPRGSRILNIEFGVNMIHIKYITQNFELGEKHLSYIELYKKSIIID